MSAVPNPGDPTVPMPATSRPLEELRANDPRQIDGYTVLRRIPGHHSSDVFLVSAEDKPGLWVIKLGATDDPERLMREARYLSRIRSPRVAKVVGSDIHEGRAYFVQEFVDGPTLADLLHEAAPQPLSTAECYRLARGLAEALRDVHAADLLHRDVKPSNIIVSATRGVTLVDFGIARAEADPRITKQGVTLGTPRYMSPEQASGVECTEATDVFQWGMVVGEALLGRHPILDIDTDGLVALARCRPDPALSGALGRLVSDTLQRSPDHRPNLGQILAELDRTEVLPGPNETMAIPLPQRKVTDLRTFEDFMELAQPRLDAAVGLLADRVVVFAVGLAAAAVLGWFLGFLLGAVLGTPWGSA